MNADPSQLKRPQNPMPDWIKEALLDRRVMEDYKQRPPYQQNDYLGWIHQAKKQETKLKRLSQMIDELEKGGVYMKMKHPASAKNK